MSDTITAPPTGDGLVRTLADVVRVVELEAGLRPTGVGATTTRWDGTRVTVRCWPSLAFQVAVTDVDIHTEIDLGDFCTAVGLRPNHQADGSVVYCDSAIDVWMNGDEIWFTDGVHGGTLDPGTSSSVLLAVITAIRAAGAR